MRTSERVGVTTMSEKNVYQRLAEVRKTVSYLKKENKSNQYDYVGSSDVLGSLHKAINDNGLLLIPQITSHNLISHVEKVTNYNRYTKKDEEKDRITYLTEIEMNMRWQNIDEPNDFLDCKWYAQGIDIAGEKGISKALTYGEKYFMLKFFNIATDKDDPDSFQKKQESRQPKPEPKPSKEQVENLNKGFEKIGKMKNMSANAVKAQMLTAIKYRGNYSNINLEQYDELVDLCQRQIKKLEKDEAESQVTKTNEGTVNWGQKQ